MNEVQILANGALAISEALVSANAPSPDNIATGGIAGLIKFATISGIILSVIGQSISNLKPVPSSGFKEGVIDLQGPGTEKSDSIPARLSKHESVMTAEETHQYKDHFQAMRDGTYDHLIYEKYLQPFKQSYADNIFKDLSLQAELNDERLLKKLSNTNMILIKNNGILVNALKAKHERR